MFNIREIDLDKLNSMTKYPSILTYHAMGERGRLTDELLFDFQGRVYATEKVDGTNTRMIFCPDGSVIVGSREDLLWEKNDLIENNTLGIVRTLKEIVRKLSSTVRAFEQRSYAIVVYFGEVFGKGVGPGKNYTTTGQTSFRLFDIVVQENYEEILALSRDKISSWREHGGQHFANIEILKSRAAIDGLDTAPLLFECNAADLPKSHVEANDWLLSLGDSRCKLDDQAPGRPEGVVVRTADRSTIAKLRREDYQRTLPHYTKRHGLGKK